ncbi:MAG TPA: hypothetical protein DEQ38_08315 [Elusimicrobia bacterium]|nr:MAG: hypothetical protein A2089_02245 [Elusimicrobia bacterium GWD2_63_28]HCC48100.1 hypothetical protein [Elusimicrobiota bacterium]
MTDAQDPKLLWFSFLKIFTRALTQINLYKPDHPQVKLALEEGQSLLTQIADSLNGGDLSITLDSDKLLINGTPLLTADKLPNSLKNLFTRFRIQTITFSKGADANDLLVLCQVQAHKGDAKTFLKERDITRIKLDEAMYAKIGPGGLPAGTGAGQGPGGGQGPGAGPGTGGGQGAGPGAGGGQGAAAGQGPGAGEGAGGGPGAGAGPGAGGGQGSGAAAADKFSGQLENLGLESALAEVVARVTPDPEERRRIMLLLTAKFKQEMENTVNRALEGIRGEKKKVENDMVRAESVMTSIADGVVVVDREGKIIMMNPQAEAISGRPLLELSGKKIVDLSQLESQVISLAREIYSDSRADISKDVSRTGPAELAETVKKATAIIQNEDGKIVGTVSIPTDAVKLKQAEQLQQDFIANMTHELRSPLTSIKAALELMSRDAASSEGDRGVLNTAIRNTERLNSIITDILDFSKLQSGKLVFRQEDEVPDEIVREAIDSMRAWATSKGLKLEASVPPNLPRVYADKRRTVQVLINLISNAIKFTPSGGSIQVSADAGKDAASGFVFFAVKDTGAGIKQEDQAKIFEKFVQAASGEKVSGTGLGLAITKAMVIMQGGKVTLESEPDRGSTFRVSMPVYKGHAEPQTFEPMPETREEAKAWWKKLLGM